MIKNSGLSIFKEIEFPDHYGYSEKDINDILVEAQRFNCKIIKIGRAHVRTPVTRGSRMPSSA